MSYYRNGWKLVVILLIIASGVFISVTLSELGDTNKSSKDSNLQQQFLEKLNEERQSKGLQPLSQRDVLTDMAKSHAQNMATHKYVGHEQPDGTTVSDRFRERDLLPECEVPADNDRGYYAGVENAFYVENPTLPLAEEMFRAWMDSEGHRKAMLLSEANEAGLGVAQVGNEHYVALEIC